MQQDILAAFSSFSSESRLEVIICLLILRTKIAFIKKHTLYVKPSQYQDIRFLEYFQKLKDEKSGRGLTLRLTANRDIAVAVAVVNVDLNPGSDSSFQTAVKSAI